LNGRPVSVGVLRELGTLLVDLHGQHDHQALLVSERQIEFLDDWIGSEAAVLLAEVSDRYAAVDSLKRKLSSLRTSRRDREQRVDMLQFQIQEIESVGPMTGESESLQVQIERLRHAERLKTGALQALNLVSENEGAALENLGSAVRELDNLADLDPTVADVVYLEVGDRTPGDEGSYPDDDLRARLDDNGTWAFVRKDGTPY